MPNLRLKGPPVPAKKWFHYILLSTMRLGQREKKNMFPSLFNDKWYYTFIVVHHPIVEFLGWPIIVLQGSSLHVNVPPQCLHLQNVNFGFIGHLPLLVSHHVVLAYKSMIADVNWCIHHQPRNDLIAPRCRHGPSVAKHTREVTVKKEYLNSPNSFQYKIKSEL